MTNLNDAEADLGLAVCINNQWKNVNTGAGANANLKADMMNFVGSDALAELVWSQQTGLAIKFAEKKPCFLWEVGSSDVRFLESEDTRDEKHISEDQPVASLAASHVSGEVKSSHVHTGPQNEGVAEPDTLSRRLFEDRMTSGVDGSGPNSRPLLEVEATDQCKPQERHESGNLEVDNGEMEKLVFFSDPFRENANVSVFKNKMIAERGDSLPCEDKKRLFLCQDNNEEHEVESHGSMGSCKSSNLLTTVKRKSSFEQQLILRSKKIKKQANECTVRKDSSFMNWISNMLKDLKNHNSYDRSFQSRKTGFQNVFQSLYLQDSRAHETIALIENKPILEIKEKEAKCLVKHTNLFERITKEAPKGMFDTIRRLRLSRTDILKWTNSQLSVADLDGLFLRLRLAKWEEGAGGSRYYVACITGLQGKNPWKGLKQPIRVKVGGVECFVESQYVSNCDFLEDELVAWWQKTSKTGGAPVVNDLKSKLAERRTLGL